MGYQTGRKPWKSEPFQQEVPDELQSSRQKLFYFGLLIVVLFAILTIQLARMQLVNGATYRLRAETNRLRELPLIPQRGLIFDRNGVPLVENRADLRRRRRRRRPAEEPGDRDQHRAAGDDRRPGRRHRRQGRRAPQL